MLDAPARKHTKRSMAIYVLNRLAAYLTPLVLLSIAIYGMYSQPRSSPKNSRSALGAFLVLLEIATFQTRPRDVLGPNRFTDRIFGKVWLRIGPLIAARELKTDIPKLVANASGTVLELGPGSGTQLSRYDISKIDRIYGVEPNANLHDALRSNVKKHGLSDMYTIVPCVVEDLEKLGEFSIEPGTVDTVMSVQVLCSVTKPAAVMKDLYRLLKPGGQMIVYEHVKSEDYLSQSVQCMSSPIH